MNISVFDYHLPPELIAQYPSERREQSRLMVINRSDNSITHTTFVHISEFFDPSDVLVVNDTKVIPARLYGQKKTTGGKIEIFLLRNLHDTVWEVLIGGKVKPGTIIEFEFGLACAVKSSGATESVLFKWQARNKGGTWVNLHSQVTKTDIGTTYVEETRSGRFKTVANFDSVPFEVRLIIQCNEANEGRAKIKNSSYVRVVYSAS